MAKLKYSISKSILAGNAQYKDYVPSAREKIKVKKFYGSAPPDDSSYVSLIWDRGGENEETIWVIQNDGFMPFEFERKGNGSKKLSLCVNNVSLVSKYFSGYIEIEVIKDKHS